jgi:FlaA1/EpsC-like NDP-sugar epimerase
VVRFGNVLGSRGSVVHTFQTQIERGGPITITHPQMTRFFMTIPEAVHLVIQAGGFGAGGELFVLNMGEPIKVVDLAKDLIRLSGLGEDDIPITFTGMRPGEKLHESLYDDDMRTGATAHSEVLRVIGTEPCLAVDLDSVVSRLEEAAREGDELAIHALLKGTVPGFVSTRTPRALPAPDAALRVIKNAR